ncbi:MAG: Uncharacterised protein [SAR116 cluster bacterium]|nr:MAG: Uncharacterised protein [SAR116 cluster bacterium]
MLAFNLFKFGGRLVGRAALRQLQRLVIEFIGWPFDLFRYFGGRTGGKAGQQDSGNGKEQMVGHKMSPEGELSVRPQ